VDRQQLNKGLAFHDIDKGELIGIEMVFGVLGLFPISK
jgi:hypothetical protein